MQGDTKHGKIRIEMSIAANSLKILSSIPFIDVLFLFLKRCTFNGIRQRLPDIRHKQKYRKNGTTYLKKFLNSKPKYGWISIYFIQIL